MDIELYLNNFILNTLPFILKKYPSWRKGQAVFNGLSTDIITGYYVEQIRATENDCFFSDDKIDNFLNEIIRISKGDK